MKIVLMLLSLTLWLLPPLSAAAPESPNQTARLRQELNQILADQRFTYPDYFAGVRRFFRNLLHWLDRLKVPKLPLKPSWPDELVNRFGLGLVILLPPGLLWLARRWLARETRLEASVPPVAASSANLHEALTPARAAAGAGEYRPAIRLLYLAALSYLRSIGKLPEGTRYSDKENLRTLRGKFGAEHSVYQAFDQLVGLFQEKWYGLKTCNAADYDRAVRLYETLATAAKGLERKNY